jgi:hypothetical protein
MSYQMTADEIRTTQAADEIVAKAEAQYEMDSNESALDAAYDKAEALCRDLNERYLAEC